MTDRQKNIRKWEDLQIKDNFMFSKVMRDKKICIALLEKLLKMIDDKVAEAKTSNKWRREYMTLLQNYREEREAGREEREMELILKMIEQGYSDAQIMMLCDVTENELDEYKRMSV